MQNLLIKNISKQNSFSSNFRFDSSSSAKQDQKVASWLVTLFWKSHGNHFMNVQVRFLVKPGN